MPDTAATPTPADDGLTHHEIKHRWSGAVLFTGRFGSMRLCVEAAIVAKTYLRGANLSSADLSGANLSSADLSSANLSSADLSSGVKATAAPARRATRADGYEFVLWPTDQGWRIAAGCRFFSMDEAAVHWAATRPRGTPLNDETHDILAMFGVHVARAEAA